MRNGNASSTQPAVFCPCKKKFQGTEFTLTCRAQNPGEAERQRNLIVQSSPVPSARSVGIRLSCCRSQSTQSKSHQHETQVRLAMRECRTSAALRELKDALSSGSRTVNDKR